MSARHPSLRAATVACCLVVATTAALAGVAADVEQQALPSFFARAPGAATTTLPVATRRAHVRAAGDDDAPASTAPDPLEGLLGHATGGGIGGLADLLAAGGRAGEEGEGEGVQVNSPPPEPLLPAALEEADVTSLVAVGDLPPATMKAAPQEEEEAEVPAPAEAVVDRPAPAPEEEGAVPEGEAEEATQPPPAPAPADDDAEEVADAALARLSTVGVVAPDLLDRFRTALAGGGEGRGEEEGGGGGSLTSRLAALFRGGGGGGGGEGAGSDPASLLGSLLGGGGGDGGGGGEEDTAAPSPPPPPPANDTYAPAAAPPPPTGGEPALALHNAARARHVDTPPLAWSPAIAAAASRVAARCVFSHSSTPFGENIAMGQRSWAEVLAAWYDGEGPRGGHRTQVVWAASRELGCGAAACGRGLGGGGTLYVCQYSPAGNVIGQGRANVKPLKDGV